MSEHRWSGWPGAWCLDCGLEDRVEMDFAGPVGTVHHRYSEVPHTEEPCAGCSSGPCSEPGSERNDPYARREREMQASSTGEEHVQG